ncbi:MAG: phage protease [Pseudomonadota bacterium]
MRGLANSTGTLAAVAAAIAIGEHADHVQLFPYGTWKGRNGLGPYTLSDRAHAERVIAATAAAQGPVDLMFDYDHQVAFAPAVAGQAPASGWIKRLVAEDDGLWADVEWTAAASARIAAREYRYTSPYFLHDKQGRITRILNAALTNTPNFNLAAVASATGLPGESRMDELDKILAALGLGEDAGADAAVASINGLRSASAAVAAVLGIDEAAAASAIVAEIKALKARAENPDPAKFVPATVADELRGQLAEINAERGEAAIAGAIKAGKLAPAEKDWAIGYYAEKGATAFASMLANRPVILAPGVQPGGDRKVEKGKLSDEELAVASAMGLTAEQFAAARDEETGA